jgi:MerR family redox-sensitive transcriptional activator SoxR
MEELTISEVARQAGIRASAIRYYESVHLLPAPRRVHGRRRYNADVLRRLSVIQLAQQVGFTVAEMRMLFESLETSTSSPSQWQTLAQQKLAEVDILIHKAAEMRKMLLERLHCDCLNFEDCIDCLLLKNQQCPSCPSIEER